MDSGRDRELLLKIIPLLASERGMRMRLDAEASSADLFATFRALVNTRPAMPADGELLSLQDELLQKMIADKGIATVDDAEDAIVNAANSQMLGCWVPGHSCIDNAIHTFAGMQLRLACARLMDEQGHEEPTGAAKVTPAFNLPARFVIHTVGPIANGTPSPIHRAQLAQCYRSCLDAASEHGLHSIAFCCISTGVFGFPADEAASLAVRTVRAWLDEHPDAGMTVVFNVFLASDEALYREQLGL